MDTNNIANVVSQVGFPIFVAVYMLYSNNKTQQTVAEAINKMENRLIQILEHVRYDESEVKE